MHETRFARFGVAETSVVSACLIVVCVGHGRTFLVDTHRRNPKFDVVSSCHGRGAISCGKFADSEVQTELFDKSRRLFDEFFKRLFAVVGVSVLHHFDFVELVTSYHTSLFRSCTARLFSEARRVCKELHREFALVDNFACVHIDECGFRGGKHKAVALSVLVAIEPVHFVAEFGELTCAETAVVSELIRRKNKFVTVLEMLVHEVVEQRPFEPCTHASVNPETVAREFDASFVVDHTEIGANVNVVFERKIEFGLFAHDFDNLVVFLFAGEKIGIGNVGHARKRVVDFCDEFVDFRVALGNLVAEFSHLFKNGFDGLTCFFKHGDLCRHLIFLRFELFDFGYRRFSLVVPSDNV